ncbi:hypothetical protein TNCV_4266291 [Trichonephila clavipes]|nr:hypothetical protein TNCV_4266291 [Trichonephila clavipes]
MSSNPRTTEDSPLKGIFMYVKSIEAQSHPVGVIRKNGEDVSAHVSSSSLDNGSKWRGVFPIAFTLL